MKKQILTVMMVAIGFATHAQNEKYIKSMSKNLAVLDTATAAAALQECNNGFERIASAEKKEWLPLYYQGYCTSRLALLEGDNTKKDAMLDKALEYADKAAELSKDNSEILTLQSMIKGMKIGIDPMNRGQKYGMQAGMLIAQAIKINPDNPRALLQKGQSTMYTPKQYGGGKELALPILEEAVKKFETFKPASSIEPNWGKEYAKGVLERCKNMED